MYTFRNRNGEVSLFCGEREIISGITPWFNTRKNPSDLLGTEDRIFLTLTDSDGIRISYRDKEGACQLTLSVEDDGKSFALRADGRYDPTGVLGHGTHINDYEGLGFDFDLPHSGNYIASYIDWVFWQRTLVREKLSDLHTRTQAMFVCYEDGKKACFMTTCDKEFKSEIYAAGERGRLKIHSNDVNDTVMNEVILIGTEGDDEYSLSETTSAFGLKVMNKPGMLRKDKKYPEIFEYLGWCSWDAFHMDVTEDDLLAKCEEFRTKDIPVRWMIIDDMWGDVTSIDRPTMHSRELNDWEADPVRFPQGLKHAVGEIKSRYGVKVGIWHPITGYWYGVNPCGKLAKEHRDLLEYTIPGFLPEGPRLMHSFDAEKAEKWYDLQHAFYKDCGIDFAKVDNQGSAERFSHLKGPVGVCSANMHRAIEKATEKYYGGALINCMGMPSENYWNRPASCICRFSDDFQPENRKWFIQHLLQCSYNSLTQGAIYTGDWDMWWSDDAQAKKNAVLRSMSGGPVYMSDELGRSIKDVIMPTVFSDGRIVRLSSPAVPARKCLFGDHEHNGRVFMVFNRSGENGILAAFNLDEGENRVTGTVSPSDAELPADGKYCVYEWFTGKTSVLEGTASMPFELENYDDFRLFIIAPVRNGRAVIGLTEKYMSPAAVSVAGNTVTALDDGTLAVYSETPIAGFESAGNGIYTKTVGKGESVTLP